MEPNPKQLSTSRAKTLFEEEQSQGVAKIEFTRVDDFTTFTAEYSRSGDDMIVHFFLPRSNATPLEAATQSATPEEVQAADVRAQRTKRLLQTNPAFLTYWTETFPLRLEPLVKQVFKMEPPRVHAAYTEEVSSWWFIVRGLTTLDPKALMHLFFVQLDQLLDSASPPSLLEMMSST